MTTQKRRLPRKVRPASRLRILNGLYRYYLTGSPSQIGINRARIHDWKHKYPDLDAEAKRLAEEEAEEIRTEIKFQTREIIQKAHQLQLKNLNSAKSMDPDTLNRIIGTMMDKLFILEGKHPDQQPKDVNVRFIFGDKNLT